MDPGASWTSGFGVQQRRFEATAGMGKRVFITAMIVGVVLLAGLAVLSSVLPKQMMQVIKPVFMLLFLLGYGFFLAIMFRGKKVILDLEPNHLVLDEGRGGVFPLSGAAFGLWHMASVGVTAGTVLHLAGGGRALRIGGRDHQPGTTLRMDVPPVENIDVMLSAEAFEALLASIPFLITNPPHAVHAPLRCRLLPNPSSAREVLSTMAPWLGTMVLAGIASTMLGSLGVFDSAAGRMIAIPFLATILVAGIVLTAVRSLRKRSSIELEVDPRDLRLRDPRTSRIIATMPLSAVSTVRGIYQFTVRGSTFEFAMLAIRMQGHDDVTLGVHDMRFGWNDAAPRRSAPRYIVGPPDWNALVEVLGVRSFVVVHGDHAT